jgi:hypothetical protein
MSDSIRIKTTPNGADNYLTLKLEQDFDFIEILSLKISQDKAYESFCSDYGVIVGRVVVNNGFGVPNAKVSVFIPLSEEDKNNSTISGIYPFENVTDVDRDGIRYNVLPKESSIGNECYTPVGTFPQKREILDNDDVLTVYCRYYKFNAVTNNSGDFMLFGVPVGTHVVHIDVDISDIGIVSQRPYDLIEQGTPEKFFYSPTKFKASKNLNSLVQIKSVDIGVNVQPFWGNTDTCEIGINRVDYNLNYNLVPHAIFMGSLFGDSDKNSVSKNCRPRNDLGKLCQQTTSEGTIEMIRKTLDNEIEELNVGGGRIIDENGTWSYLIPMNLDYVVTDEIGNIIPSDDQNRGIPTRASVRFRISMDETGGIGRKRTRGQYLIPHNPKNSSEIDFTFDKTTKDYSLRDIYWNKVYTVKNFIASVSNTTFGERYMGIKDVDACSGDKTEFPFNRARTKINPIFNIICVIITIIASIVFLINVILCALASISIFGVRPFGWINPIRLLCPTSPEQYFTPGCNGQGLESYTDCVSAVLAEQLGLYQLDFYNDWVNGTLYYYLLKYKKRRRGKTKFCEYYCDDPRGVGNSCNTKTLRDTTFMGFFPPLPAPESNIFFTEGLLVSYGDKLYYPPMLPNGLKLYATDIFSLGAVLDCDWQGFPKIIQYLGETSYNIPPVTQENPELGAVDTTTVAGMFTLGSLYDGLFFKINCLGVFYNTTQAMNIRRQSEIGVDIPDSLVGTPPNIVSINDIYDPSDRADTATSTSRFLRDSL